MTGRNRWRGSGRRPVARASTARSREPGSSPATRTGAHRSVAATVAVVGLVLLALAVGFAWPDQSVTEFGGAAVQRLNEEPDAAAVTERPTPTTGLPADPASVPVRPGEPPTPVPQQPPVALWIEAIGLAAVVIEVGVDPDSGVLDVPPPHLAGWYQYGPGLSATTGSVVIAGHVDTLDGPGVFAGLSQVSPGDEVTVEAADGQVHTFEVMGREVYHKDELPLPRYFARDGELRLTLITCGGPFDESAGDYRDNVIVTAVPR